MLRSEEEKWSIVHKNSNSCRKIPITLSGPSVSIVASPDYDSYFLFARQNEAARAADAAAWVMSAAVVFTIR